MTTATEQGPTADNVEVSMFDVSRMEEAHENWDELDEEEKLEILREAEPDEQWTEHNATMEVYHENLADLANPRTNTQVIEASHIAFGSDSTAPSPSDNGLNSENNRYEVTDHTTDFRDLQTITLLSSDQAVGDTLLEAGLVSDDTGGTFFNRVLLDDPNGRLQPKTQEYAVTVRINLQFRDQSQV